MKGKCQYYKKEEYKCLIGFCKHDHRSKDGSCRTEGIIDDLYTEEKPAHNYFQSRGKL